MHKSFLYPKEPDWMPHPLIHHHQIPVAAKSWLYESDSLTRRLRSYYGDKLTVKVLYQHWNKPFLSERTLLSQPHNRVSLVREVLLYAEQTPLILARTVMPNRTLKGAQRILSRLGNRPLGEVIFSYPKLQRIEMNIALVAPQIWSPSITEQIKITQQIWGRRTVYAIKHRQMLVSEFFLPDILTLV